MALKAASFMYRLRRGGLSKSVFADTEQYVLCQRGPWSCVTIALELPSLDTVGTLKLAHIPILSEV